jgi:hypothetical protein
MILSLFLQSLLTLFGHSFPLTPRPQVYLGKSMLLVTVDPDVARRLNYRMNNRVIQGQLQLNEDDQINSQGLVVARCVAWVLMQVANVSCQGLVVARCACQLV